jgi:two-component system NtrC family sensor kinase
MDVVQLRYLLFINFFILSFTLLFVYYYAYRLRIVLKRSEKLRALAEKFRLLFDSTTEGVFQSDLQGNFILMNRGGANILGFESLEQLQKSGLKADDFYKSSQERSNILDQIRTHRVVNNLVMDAKRKNGDLFHLEFTAHGLFDEKDQLTGMEGIFRDVTQRVRLEGEIRSYSEDLEKKVRSKTEEIISLERERVQLEKLASLGKMGASIVHEIRNPLSSIKMGLTTILKRTALSEKDHRCLELATGEVTNLERILRDLLNFSKPQKLQFTEQNINMVLDIVLSQMKDDFQHMGISVEKYLSSSLPLVRMDMDRLSQVFINILLNAKQALPDGGSIRLRTAFDAESKMVLITIEDTGIGMDEDTVCKIFNPFFSTKNEGTGLGLTISEKIIEAHSGKIQIESRLGKGTAVHIALPARMAARE